MVVTYLLASGSANAASVNAEGAAALVNAIFLVCETAGFVVRTTSRCLYAWLFDYEFGSF